jgi:hypothetical protein
VHIPHAELEEPPEVAKDNPGDPVVRAAGQNEGPYDRSERTDHDRQPKQKYSSIARNE